MTKTIILIPSRLAATRLPNKPLLKINGLSIINHVYAKAISTKIGDVFVATGDQEIFDEVTKKGGKCVLTEKDHHTGTDRIFEAYEKLELKNVDYIINLQGDEPMIDIDDVKNLNKCAINNKSDIATLACELNDKNKLNKKNIVKVYTDKILLDNSVSRAIAFSRKNLFNYKSNIYHHIGIYMYKVSILKKFVSLKQNKNEIDQKLEQLRAIENKICIDVVLAKNSPIGIDTKEDFVELKKIMNYKT